MSEECAKNLIEKQLITATNNSKIMQLSGGWNKQMCAHDVKYYEEIREI